MLEILDWLARATGVFGLLVSILGFMFREKWKQIRQMSLSSDLERLKAELARQNAEHSAAFLQQLEAMRHDFQQKLEFYKVGLIAQAEAAKAHSELRKTIALRFREEEFERLIQLELHLAPIASDFAGLAGVNSEAKTFEYSSKATEQLQALSSTCAKAEMFLPGEDLLELIDFRKALL